MEECLNLGGLPSAGMPLIRNLTPQVCERDPVFRHIHAQFIKMLDDFYFKSDEEVVAAWPVEMPPCVDSEFSDHELVDGPCRLNGLGKAKDVCKRCLSGGGEASVSAWDA